MDDRGRRTYRSRELVAQHAGDEARRAEERRLPRAGRRDDGALGDEQAALRGPLLVVLRERGPRDRAGRPAPGHRRQHHPASHGHAQQQIRPGRGGKKKSRGAGEGPGSPVGEAEAGRLVRREEGRARPPLVRHRRGAIRRVHGLGAERGGEVGERGMGKAEGGEKPQRRGREEGRK
jgi:hypothetical protein